MNKIVTAPDLPGRLHLYDARALRATVYIEVPVTDPEMLSEYPAQQHYSLTPLLSVGAPHNGRVGLFYSSFTMDLSKLLKGHAPEVSKRDFLSTFQRVAQALFHLHSLGLAHGSVSADNVVVNEDGEVSLFGLQGFFRATDEQQNQDLVEFADLVKHTHERLFQGKILGTSLQKMLSILKSKKRLKQKNIYLSSWKELKQEADPGPTITEILNVNRNEVEKGREIDRLDRILGSVSEIRDDYRQIKSRRGQDLEELIGKHLEQSRRLMRRINRLKESIENMCQI